MAALASCTLRSAPFLVHQSLRDTRHKRCCNKLLQHRPWQLARAERDSVDLDEQLLQDLERLKAKQAQQQATKPAQQGGTDEGNGALASVKEVLDKVLIADFFFILVILAWLAAGVSERAAVGSTVLLDAWFPLWDLVFQPAIGVLMLGAIVSGTVGWLKSKDSQAS